MNFALLSVHYFITGTVYNCTAEAAVPLRQRAQSRASAPFWQGMGWWFPPWGHKWGHPAPRGYSSAEFQHTAEWLRCFFFSTSSFFMWKFIISVNTEGKNTFESFCFHCREVQYDRQRDEFPWLSIMCMFTVNQLQPAQEQYAHSWGKYYLGVTYYMSNTIKMSHP